MARLACCVTAGVLIAFALAGKWIFKFLGITMPAFQIAASIVLLLVALDMLRAQRSRVHETSEETAAGVEKTDIAIAPLAIPMLAGPGAISTAILLQNRAQGWEQKTALCCCIAGVAFVSYLILRLGAHGARWLSPMEAEGGIEAMNAKAAAGQPPGKWSALRSAARNAEGVAGRRVHRLLGDRDEDGDAEEYSITEYQRYWNESERQAYRVQAEFRELWPEFDNPNELGRQIVKQVDARVGKKDAVKLPMTLQVVA